MEAGAKRKRTDIVPLARLHKSASYRMSPSLQRYLSDAALLREKKIEQTQQKFKTHVGKYRLLRSIGM